MTNSLVGFAWALHFFAATPPRPERGKKAIAWNHRADIGLKGNVHQGLEPVINLKAAQAIGHDVPAGLVLRAGKVIE